MQRKRTKHSNTESDSREISGAEDSSAPSFLAIASIAAPRGTKGEVKAFVLTDYPESLPERKAVYVDGQKYNVESIRLHKRQALIKLRGIDTIEAAEGLRNKIVEIPIDEAVPLPEDHFYHFEIIGLKVVTGTGEKLGQVVEIIQTASNDVYVVKDEKGHEILIPAIDDVVKVIDKANGKIVIDLVEGLL